MTCRTKSCPTCQACPLLSAGSDFSQPEGTGRTKVLIVGEANGEMEARDQLPFRPYAPSGAILTRTIRRLGMDREDFAISNLLRCRPYNNILDGASYEYAAVAACEPNLLEVLRQYRPKVLLAMGNLPLKHLTGLAGEKRGVGHLRGYVLRALPQFEQAAGRGHYSDPLLVVPTYHPAFLRHGAIHLTGVLARDIARAVNVAAERDQKFVLDMPDLTLNNGSYKYHPVDNPDPWDAGYADWEQRRKQEIQSDLAAWMTRNNLRYQLHPTRRDLDLFCRDVKARSDAWLALSPDVQAASYLCLSHDLETFESASLDEDATDGFTDTRIRLSQFSIEPSQGVALQWDRDGIAATRWLLKLPLSKCGQNYTTFDYKVLQAVGERDFGDRAYLTPAGQVHDTLSMFHKFQPDLPAHLQYAASFAGWMFPWKHLNESCLELYGVIDTDAALRVYQTVRKTLEDRKMWWDSAYPSRQAAGFVAQVEQFRPILARMEERGFPVDDERRRGLDVEFTAAEKEARAELDRRFPDEARKVKSYKTVPTEVRGLLEQWHPPTLPAEDATNEKGKPLGKGARAKLERAARKECYAAVTVDDLVRLRQQVFQEASTKDADGEEEEGERYYYGMRSVGEIEGQPTPPVWCRVYEFSPNSSKQLIRYMEARRHKIPTTKSGESTTGKKELDRLVAKYKDDFYTKVVECREIGKMRGTYIDGFRPHADGRVHTTFTDQTATSQLACCASWTPVRAQRGMVEIKDVQVGDLVWTHKHRWRPVLATWVHPAEPMVSVHFVNGEVLTCTTSHKVLLSSHVHIKGVVPKDGKCGEGASALSKCGITHGTNNSHSPKNPNPQRDLDSCSPNTNSRVQGLASPAKIARSERDGEPMVRKERLFAPSLDWRGERWTRIFDLLGKWEAGVCASSSDGRSIRSGEDSRRSGHTPHRRKYCEQQAGQPSHRDTSWAQGYSLTSAAGLEDVGIAEVNFVGSLPVYDITVEEDESYESCGVFSHNSRNPNITNVPKHGRLAKPIRKMFRDSVGGKLLVEWDKKSYHIMTTGWCARDKQYMRMGRLDMHSFVTWHFLKLPKADQLFDLPDEELRAQLKWLKSDEKRRHVRDFQVKRAVLGIGFAMGVNKLYDMNREYFDSLAQAKKLKDMLKDLFPKVFRWQDQIKEQAHRQGYLMNDFGAIRWFYEVIAPDGRGGWKPGDQAEEAVAFLPASLAFGDMRELMKEVARRGLDEKWEQVNTVHDSLVYLVEPGRLEEHCREMHPVLAAPSKVLVDPELAPGGLVIDVEPNAGEDWSEMKEVLFA